MISGIYCFEFSDSSMYIGKSTNIPRRWDQHKTNMLNGKHTKSVQAKFDTYGMPEFKILFTCHEHHIDIMESFFIKQYWHTGLLNSTKYTEIPEEDEEVLRQVPTEAWQISTFEHFRQWSDVTKCCNTLRSELEAIKSGTRIEELEDEIECWREDLQRMEEKVFEKSEEIYRLKHRGLFKRIFNIY